MDYTKMILTGLDETATGKLAPGIYAELFKMQQEGLLAETVVSLLQVVGERREVTAALQAQYGPTLEFFSGRTNAQEGGIGFKGPASGLYELARDGRVQYIASLERKTKLESGEMRPSVPGLLDLL